MFPLLSPAQEKPRENGEDFRGAQPAETVVSGGSDGRRFAGEWSRVSVGNGIRRNISARGRIGSAEGDSAAVHRPWSSRTAPLIYARPYAAAKSSDLWQSVADRPRIPLRVHPLNGQPVRPRTHPCRERARIRARLRVCSSARARIPPILADSAHHLSQDHIHPGANGFSQVFHGGNVAFSRERGRFRRKTMRHSRDVAVNSRERSQSGDIGA